MNSNGSNNTPAQEPTALQRFSRDLTEVARSGKLDPVIGRDDEIRRLVTRKAGSSRRR